ncbi:MAG: glutamate--tRNA ligase [bacterium]
MANIRLRLAPSPTGFLHIGNLRTALFGYLLAKSQGGQYILRIEDTDQKREVTGAVDSLIQILDWVGIKFDEGPHQGGDYGPYVQTERLAIYQKHVADLLAKKQAYHCFCSSEDLDKKRAEQANNKQAPRYDRTCRDLSKKEVEKKIKEGASFVIRQAMPLSGQVVVHDELRGDITFPAADLEDQVLVKSNGIPTYQLANVIDDHLMVISHVTRGEEWLPSFPKNILLYQALGWTPPKFIHLPLLLNKGGGKLSKRQGDVFVEDFKQLGYLPEALINFCALLGWHPQTDNEILTMSQLLQNFSLDGLGSSPAIFDLDKLDYLNGYYIRQMALPNLTKLCRPYLADYLAQATPEQQTSDYLQAVIRLEQARLKKLADIKDKTEFFFTDIHYESELLIWKKSDQAKTKIALSELLAIMEKINKKNWTQGSLEETIINYLKAKEASLGDYLWPLRVALTGQKASPGPFEVGEVLGKDLSLARLQQAIEKL